MITLTANTTLHCNCNTGSDSTGNGSSGNPFKTPAGAMTYLNGVDFSGFNVIIKLDIAGTYNFSFTVDGLFIGQTGQPYQLTIQGDNTGNFNTANTYILSALPDHGGCITATFRAALNIVGVKFDMYNSLQGPNGIDGGGMALNIGSQSIVVCNNTVWGYQISPYAYINVAAQSQLIIENTIWCNPQASAVIGAFLGVGQSAYATLSGTSIWLSSNVPTFEFGVVTCDEGGDVTWANCPFIEYETYLSTSFTHSGTNQITISSGAAPSVSNGGKVLGVGFPPRGATILSGAGTTVLTLDYDPTSSSGTVTIGSPAALGGPGFCIAFGSILNSGTVNCFDVDNSGDLLYFPGDQFTTTLATAANAGDITIEVSSVGTYPGAGIHAPNPPVALGFLLTQCIQGSGIAAATRVADVSGNTITLTKPILQNMTIATPVSIHGASTDDSWYR